MLISRLLKLAWLFALLLTTGTALGQVVALDYPVRHPVKAGSWYPGTGDELLRRIKKLSAETEDTLLDPRHGKLRALIVPHAGYDYSGSTAAAGYKLINGKKYKRVVIIGAAHYGDVPSLSILDVHAYTTPLGMVELDRKAVDYLGRSPLVIRHPTAHAQEHSIEMQLPFLQVMLQPGWKLVPILVGDMYRNQYRQSANIIKPLLDDDTLLVVSGDFTHYGPGYDFVPFPLDENTARRIALLDKQIIEHIKNVDPDGLAVYRYEKDLNDCVYPAAMILLNLLPGDTKINTVRYMTSGAVTGNYRNSVSYVALSFQRKSRLADSSR